MTCVVVHLGVFMRIYSVFLWPSIEQNKLHTNQSVHLSWKIYHAQIWFLKILIIATQSLCMYK
jgi:hypothetical protein